MKVVILTLTYPPEPAEHIHDLARHLVLGGHSVTVLTSLPSYPFGRVYPAYRGRLWSRENMDGVRVLRFAVIPSHSKSLARRALYYLCNSMAMLLYLMFRPERHDVTLAYHPPITVAIPAFFCHWARRIPFVYWIQDLWPETIEAQSGVTRLTRLIGRLSARIYRAADQIVVLSQGFRDNLVQKQVEAGKITVIPNWADASFFRPVPVSDADYQRHRLDPLDFHVFYSGNLGFMQSLEHVALAARYLEDLKRVKIVFMGTGVREGDLREICTRNGLSEQVIFLGRVPQDEVNLCYALADAFVVHVRDVPLNRISIPHKIYGYLLAAKPVIAALRGEARGEIVRAGAGIACEPESAPAIAGAIRALAAAPKARLAAMGGSGREFVRRERSLESLAPGFETVLSRSASRGRREPGTGRPAVPGASS